MSTWNGNNDNFKSFVFALIMCLLFIIVMKINGEELEIRVNGDTLTREMPVTYSESADVIRHLVTVINELDRDHNEYKRKVHSADSLILLYLDTINMVNVSNAENLKIIDDSNDNIVKLQDSIAGVVRTHGDSILILLDSISTLAKGLGANRLQGGAGADVTYNMVGDVGAGVYGNLIFRRINVIVGGGVNTVTTDRVDVFPYARIGVGWMFR